MITLILIIIYLAFISLGLPDSLLGSAWPVMQADLSVEASSAGIISMLVCGGTIISSLFSGKLINRFGTGKITFVSVTMTAFALLGFSISHTFIWLCIMAVPLGLGAGSVDVALNNFVALHYKAKHMSWLHCFWGIGATSGPIIMSLFLANNSGWQKGYFTISIIQFSLVFVLFLTLSLWKHFEKNDKTSSEHEETNTQKINPLRIPGVKLALVSFVCYCATEATAGLWGSSYLVNYKGLSVDDAARGISLFYGGITLGRFLAGFITMKFNNRILIRCGQILCIIGAVLLILPFRAYFSLIGLILIGLGCAPIYPAMLHETPNRFGKDVSQSIMGMQMAFAYIGSTFMPPILGFLASKTSIMIFPYFLLFFMIVMLIGSEKINVFIMKRKSVKSLNS